MRANKYALYERSVQSPANHLEWYVEMHRTLRGGTYPRKLREDFCGTFALSAEWVRRNRRNSALCLDLDPEPLAYGRRVHLRTLTPEQRQRITVKRLDVATTTRPGSDLIVAGNFSVFIFKERKRLLAYLRAANRSLAPGGLLILEVAGGPGMIETVRERRTFHRGGKPWFTYVWDQKSFDPITRLARYAIHFAFPGGRKRLTNAFRYDWRLWTIPELRDAMAEAGFASSHVYWETTHRGEGTGEYLLTESGDNAHSWVTYVVGIGGKRAY